MLDILSEDKKLVNRVTSYDMNKRVDDLIHKSKSTNSGCFLFDAEAIIQEFDIWWDNSKLEFMSDMNLYEQRLY